MKNHEKSKILKKIKKIKTFKKLNPMYYYETLDNTNYR